MAPHLKKKRCRQVLRIWHEKGKWTMATLPANQQRQSLPATAALPLAHQPGHVEGWGKPLKWGTFGTCKVPTLFVAGCLFQTLKKKVSWTTFHMTRQCACDWLRHGYNMFSDLFKAAPPWRSASQQSVGSRNCATWKRGDTNDGASYLRVR